jgi:hypothetical protein
VRQLEKRALETLRAAVVKEPTMTDADSQIHRKPSRR